MGAGMDLVVKAKHENVLKRFRVRRMEDGSVHLSLAGLKSKICGLFDFDPSEQFVITYVDEHNDIVTMADDNDLLDVWIQDLNPLRLEVSLMSQNNRATGKQAQSQPSTPRKFSRTKEQGQAFDLRSICSEETLKFTKALRKAILKCTKETANVASTAAVAELIEDDVKLVSTALAELIEDVVKLVSTHLAELIEDIVKLVSTHLGPVMERQQTGGAGSGTQPNSAVPSINESAEQGTGNAQPTSGDRFIPSSQLPSRQAHGFGLKGNQRLGENIHPTTHKGIYCDRCGTLPITGPRYRKDDFDLCQSCFSDVGNEEDYEKLDRALSSQPAPHQAPHKERSLRKGRRSPKSPAYRPSKYTAYIRSPGSNLSNSPPSIYGSQGVWQPVYRPSKYPAYTRSPGCNLSNSPTSIYGSQGPSAGKPANKATGNLDGRFVRFVQDATTVDGTEFAPGTHFTKIWRLRNDGTLKWPCQTQLVRNSGDDLGTGGVVNLEIPKEGFEVGKELDVTVHFIAPIQPGRYGSYWRLMAPSGEKFGKRVWILIQVVQRVECLPNLMESLLTLAEVEQNNLTQEQTKQKTVDVSSQDTSERACLGDSKMDLDPNELGCSSMVADKGKQPSSLVEVGNAFTQSQRVDFPTEMQGASSQHKC